MAQPTERDKEAWLSARRTFIDPPAATALDRLVARMAAIADMRQVEEAGR